MIVKTSETLPMKKCIIYASVPSAKQTSDGAGLTSQEQSCREYAARVIPPFLERAKSRG